MSGAERLDLSYFHRNDADQYAFFQNAKGTFYGAVLRSFIDCR